MEQPWSRFIDEEVEKQGGWQFASDHTEARAMLTFVQVRFPPAVKLAMDNNLGSLVTCQVSRLLS